MIQKRDFAIDLIKFFAVFLIINSHADIMYPRFKMLATGGAIGDALFLFCSGFTLFLGKQVAFDNYYKRRINRIYPSVFICMIAGTLINGSLYLPILALGGGEFVIAIMIYYVFLFYVSKYALNKLNIILFVIGLITLIVYILFYPYKYETSSKGIYGVSTYFRWIPYSACMLLGAKVGIERNFLRYNTLFDGLKLLSCFVLFYAIQLASKVFPIVAPSQIITLFPLMGILFYGYKYLNAQFFYKLYNNRKINKFVLFVSGVCLESYLIQYNLITDRLNNIFPFNILLIFTFIIIVSFVLKCVAKIFSQTFRNEDYVWRDIFKLT